ncbi:MAG: 2-oxo acid dehydrogenase subunit E2 [Sandaracinaceae bacterium]|nr:2-oxo acid dehydrogenase subunit E2 [Sandaracinaceae bacterium]
MPTWGVMGDLLGSYQIEKPAFLRRLAMDSFAALPAGHAMTAFMELDVTAPLARIEQQRAEGGRVSLFAHVLRSIAVAIAEHPDLNVIRHGASRIARFEDVDVSVPVEVETAEGRFPLQLVIRRAQDKSAPEIFAEIEAARHRHEAEGALGDEDRWGRRTMRLASLVPRFLRVLLIRRMIADAKLVKRRAGTTLVTSVGKFASIPGFVSPLSSGPRAATFAIGSLVDKPVVRDGEVVVRSILAVTVVFDHDLVDGGPAARFASRLRELVEG